MIDFLSCLPLGYIGFFLDPASLACDSDEVNESSSIRAVKTLRLTRLSKMLRLARVVRILRKYEEMSNIAPYINLIFTLFCIFFAAHLLSCFFYLVGTTDQIQTGCTEWDQASKSWNVTETDGCETIIIGWVRQQGWPASVGTGTRYLTSMYYVFNAIENGNTNGERGFALLATLVCGFIYGALAATITNSLLGASVGEQVFNQRFAALKEWMQEKNLPKATQSKIRAYYTHRYKSKVYFNERELQKELPPAMNQDINHHLYGELLVKLPLLAGLGKNVLHRVAECLVPTIAMRDQVIMEQDTAGSEMYILVKGEVVVHKDGEQLGYLQEGAFFGESALIGQGGKSRDEIRSRTVKAMTECELAFLRRIDVDKLQAEYPELRVKLRRMARPTKEKDQQADQSNIDESGCQSAGSDHQTKHTDDMLTDILGHLEILRDVDNSPSTNSTGGPTGRMSMQASTGTVAAEVARSVLSDHICSQPVVHSRPYRVLKSARYLRRDQPAATAFMVAALARTVQDLKEEMIKSRRETAAQLLELSRRLGETPPARGESSFATPAQLPSSLHSLV